MFGILLSTAFKVSARPLNETVLIESENSYKRDNGGELLAKLWADNRCNTIDTEYHRSDLNGKKCANVDYANAHSITLMIDGAFYWDKDCKIKATSHAVDPACNFWTSGHQIMSVSF
ncbi:unnamed protein product [Sympodiomycopsis kandeliae]